MDVNGTHVSGFSVGALFAYAAAHFGWSVSTDEALQWGAAIGFGVATLAHVANTQGLWPAVQKAIMGPAWMAAKLAKAGKKGEK